MKCMKGKKITHIKGNPRYRLVQVRGENYLLDLDQHRWLMFIPFIYWFVPHFLYRVHGDVLSEIELQPMEKVRVDPRAYLLASSAIGTNVFYFLSTYLSFDFPLWINIAMLVIVTVCVIGFRMYLSTYWKEKMAENVDLKDRQTERVFIIPMSPLVVLMFGFLTLITVSLGILGFRLVMEEFNVLFLLFYTVCSLGYVLLVYIFATLDRFALLFLTR